MSLVVFNVCLFFVHFHCHHRLLSMQCDQFGPAGGDRGETAGGDEGRHGESVQEEAGV